MQAKTNNLGLMAEATDLWVNKDTHTQKKPRRCALITSRKKKEIKLNGEELNDAAKLHL